jgi:hypothetical protein
MLGAVGGASLSSDVGQIGNYGIAIVEVRIRQKDQAILGEGIQN